MTARELLLKQTADAFKGRPDMSLLGSLKEITQAEADWRADQSVPTIGEIVRHVAWAKSRFCHEAFGVPMVIVDPNVNDAGDTAGVPWEFPCGAAWGLSLPGGIGKAVELLENAQQVLTRCLESCSEESLDRPIPTHHGKTAANFFWIMIMHDIYHAGQIRTRRTMFKFS